MGSRGKARLCFCTKPLTHVMQGPTTPRLVELDVGPPQGEVDRRGWPCPLQGEVDRRGWPYPSRAHGLTPAAGALALLARWRCWHAGAAGALGPLALRTLWRCWRAGAAGALALLPGALALLPGALALLAR